MSAGQGHLPRKLSHKSAAIEDGAKRIAVSERFCNGQRPVQACFLAPKVEHLLGQRAQPGIHLGISRLQWELERLQQFFCRCRWPPDPGAAGMMFAWSVHIRTIGGIGPSGQQNSAS